MPIPALLTVLDLISLNKIFISSLPIKYSWKDEETILAMFSEDYNVRVPAGNELIEACLVALIPLWGCSLCGFAGCSPGQWPALLTSLLCFLGTELVSSHVKGGRTLLLQLQDSNLVGQFLQAHTESLEGFLWIIRLMVSATFCKAQDFLSDGITGLNWCVGCYCHSLCKLLHFHMN